MIKASFVSLLLGIVAFASDQVSSYSAPRLFVNSISSVHHSSAVRRTTFSTAYMNVGAKVQQQEEKDGMPSGLDRSTFISKLLFSCVSCTIGLTTEIARANAADDSLKGTKKDPAFEACLGKCMYECTKPKGSEQKSRAVCLPECKKSCATTKAQLLKGQPLN
jgi:hypothetical protein